LVTTAVLDYNIQLVEQQHTMLVAVAVAAVMYHQV
jgi:hypothetical protein